MGRRTSSSDSSGSRRKRKSRKRSRSRTPDKRYKEGRDRGRDRTYYGDDDRSSRYYSDRNSKRSSHKRSKDRRHSSEERHSRSRRSPSYRKNKSSRRSRSRSTSRRRHRSRSSSSSVTSSSSTSSSSRSSRSSSQQHSDSRTNERAELRAKLEAAARAATSASQRLANAGVLDKSVVLSDARSAALQIERSRMVDDIETSGFSQRAFTSSRGSDRSNKTAAPAYLAGEKFTDTHALAMFGTLQEAIAHIANQPAPKTNWKDKPDMLIHESLLEDPERKLERWRKRLQLERKRRANNGKIANDNNYHHQQPS